MDRSNISFSAPTIDNVRDATGEVVDGGSTYDTTVSVEGDAGGNERVEILDKTEILSTVPATAQHWAATLPSLAFKTYSIKARGIHGSPESEVRTFSVIYRGEDFETGLLGVIPANTAREFPAMAVTPKDKDATLINDSVAAPFITGKAISFADDSSVRFVLESPVNKITFGAFAMAGSFDVEAPYLSCFDERDALLFERKLDFGFDFAAWHEVVSTDRRIKTLVLTVNRGTSAFHVDNFTFF